MLDLGPASFGGHVRVRCALGHDAVQSRSLEAIEPIASHGEPFGHDTVETGSFEPAEPVFGALGVRSGGRQVDRRGGVAQRRLQEPPPLTLRGRAKVSVIEGEQVPGDERRRRLCRQQLHPRCGRMDAQQQRVEIEAVRTGNHNFAVKDAALREGGHERRRQFREVAVEGL